MSFWETTTFSSDPIRGHCHTYNPPDNTLAKFQNRIGIFLGNTETFNSDKDQMYFIYLHERGQFWLNPTFPNIVPINLNMWEQKSIRFRAVVHDNFADENMCEKDKGFSLNNCMKEFVRKDVGCFVDWHQAVVNTSCQNSTQFSYLRRKLFEISDFSFEKLVSLSGCR